MPQTVQIGNTVSVDYTGKLENGDIFDTSIGKESLTFKTGSGQMIPGFEAAVINMAIGESKTVSIPPSEGYGERDDDFFLSMPLADAPPNIKFHKGMMLDLADKDGNPIPAEVIAIDEETVTLDINHPLAGETLIFEIDLLKIEE
ncbi:peptidylprolyl isomerase [bacterium]|nr:peptidylprolyl isomerase [bacterium]